MARNSNGKNSKNTSHTNRNARRNDRNDERRDQRSDAPNAESRITDSKAKGGTNHIEWYVPDPNLLANVANIPFGYRTGDALRVAGESWRLPGVTAIQYVPTMGDLTNPQSPANVAAVDMYQFIRRANSGAKVRDAADFALFIHAMDSIYTGIMYCQRAIGFATTFDRTNIYYPRGLFTAMGVDFDDIVGNVNSYMTRLNSVILKASTLAVPADFPLFRRHAYMTSYVFTDEANTNAQMYVFTPRNLYKFGLDSEYKGELEVVQWHRTVKPLSYYLDILEDMIGAVYGDEDAGLMTGDILKAYGENGIFKITTLMQDFSLLPKYDEEILNQIHNAVVVNAAPSNVTQVIEDNGNDGTTGYLTQSVTVTLSSESILEYYNNSKLFDLHIEATPESVMRSTRLMTGELVPVEDGPELTYALHAYPTEIVVSMVVYTYNTNSDLGGEYIVSSFSGPVDVTSGSTTLLLQLLDRASQISYFPLIPVLNASGWRYIGNTDRVTIITNSNIELLNQVATLGEVNVNRVALS